MLTAGVITVLVVLAVVGVILWLSPEHECLVQMKESIPETTIRKGQTRRALYSFKSGFSIIDVKTDERHPVSSKSVKILRKL